MYLKQNSIAKKCAEYYQQKKINVPILESTWKNSIHRKYL